MAYPWRLRSEQWDEEADPERFMDIDTQSYAETSSIARDSSPPVFVGERWDYTWPESEDTEADLNFESEPEQHNSEFTTDAARVRHVLQYIKSEFPRLSLKNLLYTIFTCEDPYVKASVGIFLKNDSGVGLMEKLWGSSQRLQLSKYNEEMSDWVVSKAAEVCAYECSRLTDSASDGPHYAEAERLRVSAKSVTVAMVRGFKTSNLTALYDKTMPRVQKILQAVMQKGTAALVSSRRDTVSIRTLNFAATHI